MGVNLDRCGAAEEERARPLHGMQADLGLGGGSMGSGGSVQPTSGALRQLFAGSCVRNRFEPMLPV